MSLLDRFDGFEQSAASHSGEGKLFCPSCGRAWVPGEARCPFCGATPGGAAVFSSSFQLQWIDPWDRPWRWPIPPRGLSLGRDVGNDVVVCDAQVSPYHALLWVSGEQVYALDGGSTNGTWINERRITGPHPLQEGDRLRIGGIHFTLVRAGPFAPRGVPGGYTSASSILAMPEVGPSPRIAKPAGFTAGHLFAFAGTLVVLVMFFLPWVHLTGLGITQRYSAFEMMRMEQSLGLGEMAKLMVQLPPAFPMPLWLLIISPLMTLLSLFLAAVGLPLHPRQRLWVLLFQFAAALLAAFIQAWFLASLPAFQSRLSLLSITLDTDFALWCSLAGTALVFFGSILDIALAFPISSSPPQGKALGR